MGSRWTPDLSVYRWHWQRDIVTIIEWDQRRNAEWEKGEKAWIEFINMDGDNCIREAICLGTNPGGEKQFYVWWSNRNSAVDMMLGEGE